MFIVKICTHFCQGEILGRTSQAQRPETQSNLVIQLFPCQFFCCIFSTGLMEVRSTTRLFFPGRRDNFPRPGELCPIVPAASLASSPRPAGGGRAGRFYWTMTMPARVPLGISSGLAPLPMG